MSTQYRYKIEMYYPYQDNKEILFESDCIKSVMIDYEYDDLNMPIIYVQANLDKNIIDDMIKNKNKYIRLKVSKYVNNSSPYIYEKYIEKQFTYFLNDNNLNEQKEIDYSKDTKDSKDVYKMITIGLMDQDLINNNKKIINDIYLDQKLVNILLCELSDAPIILEPPTNNKRYDKIIIEPIDTKTKFIKYIDDNYGIYDTEYRLFYDYDKTYLLSSSGKCVPSKDELYSTIIFYVDQTSSIESREQGMDIDNNQKAYLIDIDTNNINLVEDTASIKSFDNIIGIDSSGNVTKENIDLEGSTSTNTVIVKTNNLNSIYKKKKSIEDKNINVSIFKTDLDSSVFTMNKEYFIKNYDKLSNKEGKFVITSKREIYTKDRDTFIQTLSMTFKKIN